MKLKQTGRFRRGFKRMSKRGKSEVKLKKIAKQISTGDLDSLATKDHQLKGKFKAYRECHIEPDWLLVYRITDDGQTLELYDTGTHQDIFGV